MDKTVAQPARILREERTPSGANYTNADIGIDILVNARGRACLLHNKPFIGTPTWIKYLTNQKKLKMVFDNGTEFVYDHIASDKMHKALLNVTKLFVIRVEKGMPMEGFDTTLIKE